MKNMNVILMLEIAFLFTSTRKNLIIVIIFIIVKKY